LSFVIKYWKWILAAGLVLLLWLKSRKRVDSTSVVVNPSKLSYSLNQYLVYADQIEGALHIGDAWSPYEDDTAVQDVLMSMQNDDDFYQLVKAYGVRETTWPTELNLVETIEAYLDSDNKEAVNVDYAGKGMNVRV
jgi:hypothetical protein